MIKELVSYYVINTGVNYKIQSIGRSQDPMSFKRGQVYACNPQTARGVSTKLSSHRDKIVYTNGRTVIIRDINRPAFSTSYSGHVHPATVARISPSGYYCASADSQGTVRVWDIVGEDQILKSEVKVIAGKINDLAWDGESKRIIAVGDGRERYGHVFMMDTGSSAGEIIGHSKPINGVSIRHQRPFRAATAGDDGLIVFHHGTPYKYEMTIKTHTRFVQDVQFSPSGDLFASFGSDAKAFLYDGKTGDTLAELTDNPHKGSIMAGNWSPDSKFLVTSSADCSVKLWDVETRKVVTTWALGSGVNHQQVGNIWAEAEGIVSLSASGDLNVFDRRVPDKPSRVLYGAQKGITASTLSDGTFYAGSYDGRIVAFSALSGETMPVEGDGHTNQVSGLAHTGSRVFSTGYDDQIREIGGNKKLSQVAPTLGQPKGIATLGDVVFVVSTNGIEAIKDRKKVFSLNVNYNPSAIAVHGKMVAVGGEDHKVYLNQWDGSQLKQVSILDNNRGTITAICFSPDGGHLVAGDSSGKIILYDPRAQKMITSRWTFHSARINSIAFTPNGNHVASGSLDTHIYIWDVENHGKNIPIKNAGTGGVYAVAWANDKCLLSAGADACVRSWEITF